MNEGAATNEGSKQFCKAEMEEKYYSKLNKDVNLSSCAPCLFLLNWLLGKESQKTNEKELGVGGADEDGVGNSFPFFLFSD